MTSKTIEQSTIEDVVGQLIADQAMITLLLIALKNDLGNVSFSSLKKILDESDSAEIRQAFVDRVEYYQSLFEGIK